MVSAKGTYDDNDAPLARLAILSRKAAESLRWALDCESLCSAKARLDLEMHLPLESRPYLHLRFFPLDDFLRPRLFLTHL